MALVSSGVLRGRCPVCGAANCRCGGPTDVVPVDERMEVRQMRGPLVRIPGRRPGEFVKVTEAEARALGHLPPAEPEPKARPPARNKARRPAGNKAGGEE